MSEHMLKVTHNLTLACLLESAVSKPGNVSPTHTFHSTRYEHYLAGSVAVGLTLGKLAGPDESIPIGKTVFEAVKKVHESQSGGNTHLGIILLLAPLARASRAETPTPDVLRAHLQNVLDNLGAENTEWYFNAINLANPSGLLPVSDLDVREYSTLEKIKNDRITVKQWMDVSKEFNSISYEYITDFELTFEFGLAYITSMMAADEPISINDMVLRSYLKLLSIRPDTLVWGKFDKNTADNVSEEAKSILDLYEAADPHAQAAVEKFNTDLASKKINPGMTADLTAATLYVALMMGLKL